MRWGIDPDIQMNSIIKQIIDTSVEICDTLNIIDNFGMDPVNNRLVDMNSSVINVTIILHNELCKALKSHRLAHSI